MTGLYTYSRTCKPVVGLAITGFVLASLFCNLDGAPPQGCNLFDKTAWVALDVLHMVILLADWQAVLAYPCEGSRFLEHVLQIGTSIWPLLCVMASEAY